MLMPTSGFIYFQLNRETGLQPELNNPPIAMANPQESKMQFLQANSIEFDLSNAKSGNKPDLIIKD
jgi:hypothetical protein